MSLWQWDELIPTVQDRLERRYPNSPDIVQETLMRLFILLSGGLEVKVSAEALAIGIADNVQKEQRRTEGRFTEIFSEFAATDPAVSLPGPTEEEVAKLKKEVFSSTERKIFDEYYSFRRDIHGRRERLARRLGVSKNTLYQRMFRLKERLSREYRSRQRKENDK